jgi:hypothetical protein
MRLKSILALSLAIAGVAGGASAAVLSGPLPANTYTSYLGLDWAWVSPAGDFGYDLDFTEQSTYGWRLPTAQEVSTFIAPDFAAFVAAFVTPLGNQVGPDGNFACASAWFDPVYAFCDYGDAAAGFIWNLTNSGTAFEVFAVRGNVVAPVPLPAAFPLLVAAIGGIGFVGRRKRRNG